MSEQPESELDLTMDQRCVLHAYWRQNAYTSIGIKVTVRTVADLTQSDAGYGTVPRAQVPEILRGLRDLGWKINVCDLADKPARKKAEVTDAPPPAPIVNKEPVKKRADKRVPNPRPPVVRSVGVGVKSRDPDELRFTGELRGAVVHYS